MLWRAWRAATIAPRLSKPYTFGMRRSPSTSSTLLFALLVVFACLARSPVRADGVATRLMDAHMETTVHAPAASGDAARAAAILAAAKAVMAKYPTVEAAEKAGFTKFLPTLELPIEHYTNRDYALEAWSGTFDAMHPTSLIFKRSGERQTLVGVMYTAKRDAETAELDRRVPLSVAQWHRHIADCAGPAGTPRSDYFGANARFGLLGSIATKAACDAAGGTFRPIIFGWMVHVWPLETEPAKIWAVDPDGSMSHGSMTMER